MALRAALGAGRGTGKSGWIQRPGAGREARHMSRKAAESEVGSRSRLVVAKGGVRLGTGFLLGG